MTRVLGLAAWVTGGSALLWFSEVGSESPEAVVFAVIRGAGLLAGVYLLAVLGVGVAVRTCRLRLLGRFADALTPGALRRLLDRSLGVVAVGSVAATVSLGPVAPAVAAEGPPVTLRGLHRVAPSPEPTTTTTVVVPPMSVPVEPVAQPPPSTVYEPLPVPAAAPTWQVRRGDHFWSIAQRVLADAWGRPATSDEVAPYWRSLVAENRPRLADPDNADLLFAGQVLALPQVPSAPAQGST
jgi:hypothetical protein